MANKKRQNDTDVKEKVEVSTPRDYQVILHNDDFTPMDFVMNILTKIFGKTVDEAYAITMKVHKDGIGVAGIYSFDIAETKVFEVKNHAERNGHPLNVTMEPL